MLIKGYFHVALMHGGNLIASEMHGRFMQSGLYDATDTINVTILGPEKDAQYLRNYIFDYHSKYKIRHCSENLEDYEFPTLKMIKDDVNQSDEYLIWYMHTKGASNCRPDVSQYIQHNIRSWRGVMCHAMMNQRDKAINMLVDEGVDATGPFWKASMDGSEYEGTGYFIGNFWWTKSGYARNLPSIVPPLIEKRYISEIWIGLGKGALKGLSQSESLDLYDFSGKKTPQGPLHGLPGSSEMLSA